MHLFPLHLPLSPFVPHSDPGTRTTIRTVTTHSTPTRRRVTQTQAERSPRPTSQFFLQVQHRIPHPMNQRQVQRQDQRQDQRQNHQHPPYETSSRLLHQNRLKKIESVIERLRNKGLQEGRVTQEDRHPFGRQLLQVTRIPEEVQVMAPTARHLLGEGLSTQE